MFASLSTSWSYDAIADVYATDMGQSMPFDDVGWYRALCSQQKNGAARVLELGCGTGRILIELLRVGVDAIGADRSLPMLARLARDAAMYTLQPRLVQMDVAAPALRSPFDVILLPYSLITYLRDPAVARATVARYAALLAPGGCLIVDAFVPKPVASFAEFRKDYRRTHGAGMLERHKRISANADGTNRIERRYRVLDSHDAVIEEFSTDETIRPYASDDLMRFGAAAGLDVESLTWDYAANTRAAGASFATVVLRKPSNGSEQQRAD